MQTKLPLNGTIQHPDLAEALRGDSGTFFCQQGGQGYIVTAAEGFSIKSLRPVGRKIVEATVVMQTTPEPWAITKISEDVLEFSSIPQQSPRQQRAAFFQPLPFPSRASAGSGSAGRSTSSGVSSQPTSMRDFS